MASSGHFSSVTSVEVVPSTAAGSSLLASEEGMERHRNVKPIDGDPVYHFIHVPNVFAIHSRFYVSLLFCFTFQSHQDCHSSWLLWTKLGF